MDEFKHKLDQKVTDPLGQTGIVIMLGIDDGGKKCFVQTVNNSCWWKEDQLKAAAGRPTKKK